jgi:hypothetical protein
MKRFINADIVAGKRSNAITLNRFAYADGNPVSNVDPFGLAPNMFVNACVKDDGGGSIKPLNLQSSTTSAPKSPTATAPATPIIPTTPSHLERATIKDGSSNNNYIYSSEPYWEDLLTNNCLHYVEEILSYGEADNRFVEDYLNNSIQIVPTLYYDSLNSITQNDFLDTLDAILP